MDNSIYCKISTELLFSACLVSMYFVFRIIFMRLCGKVNFIWSIAELLRGPYKKEQYGDVILPMAVLRRYMASAPAMGFSQRT